jgi:hypothetical protein
VLGLSSGSAPAPYVTDGASLSDRVYALALERIDELMGCTEDSPEERELSLWAEIADRIEQIAWVDDADARPAQTTGLDAVPPAVSGSRQVGPIPGYQLHAGWIADADQPRPAEITGP